MVSSCDTCLKFSPNKRLPKPYNQLRQVPVITWMKVATEIFTFDNCNYLLMVDYMSKFPIFCKLPSLTIKVVTEMIKLVFSEDDKPTTTVSDNGPCYSSEYFAREMNKLGINCITTLPHHHQSNWLADVYVEISKAIILKAKDAKEDPSPGSVGIQDYTTISLMTSPVEGTHRHKPRGDLPIGNAALRAKGIVVELRQPNQ